MDTAQREIKRLWERGRNTAQIAKEIEWSEPDVDNEVHKIIQRRYLEREGRECLMCREKFVSEGNANRVCDHCKDGEMWE